MASYPDDQSSRGRRDRPYPDDMDDRPRRPRPGQGESGAGEGPPADEIPRPPMGEALRPAMKRDGSRSRVSSDTRPQFPDEASYLGGRAPDLEGKNRPRDRRFRDKRDGYTSDEGEQLRRSTPRRPPRDDNYARGPDSRRPRPRDEGRATYPPDAPPPYRRDPYDDDKRSSARNKRDSYDDRRPPPRRRRDDDDDDLPPRRRGDRTGPEVEYGSDPIPARRRSERLPPTRRPPPRRGYDDSDDDDYRPRRRRSHDESDRRPARRDDRDSYVDRDGRRRRDDYDRPRRDRSRRRYDDDDDYDDRYDRRSDRDRDRNKPPKELKIGNYDVGPLLEKGQKHYGALAPVLTPLVMGMAKKYLGSSGGK